MVQPTSFQVSVPWMEKQAKAISDKAVKNRQIMITELRVVELERAPWLACSHDEKHVV